MAWFLLPLFLLTSINAEILPVDSNCTQGTGNATKWAINSNSCSNNYTQEACQAIYSGFENSSAISAGGNAPRPWKCYSLDGGKTFNQEVKLIAIATCAKFCGYCCLTPNYTSSKTDCTKLTQANCTNSQQKDALAKDCPSTCGLCLYVPPPPCVDTNANCISWIKNSFCYNSYYTVAQRKAYCAKSCNLC